VKAKASILEATQTKKPEKTPFGSKRGWAAFHRSDTRFHPRKVSPILIDTHPARRSLPSLPTLPASLVFATEIGEPHPSNV
jgi:hypothetical protein